MAYAKDFAKELNALITRYIDGGCDPQDVAEVAARSKSRSKLRVRALQS